MRRRTEATPQALQAALQAAVATLQLQLQDVCAASLAGLGQHSALRQKTGSHTFREHKIYSPGDNLRHLDWKAFAKTERYHLRLYDETQPLSLHLLLDTSASMCFPNAAPQNVGTDLQAAARSKASFAAWLAGALATLALQQGDAANLYSFNSVAQQRSAASHQPQHLPLLLMQLLQQPSQGQTRLTWQLQQLAMHHSLPPAYLFILSDLFEADAQLFPTLALLRARGHQITVLHVLHAQEINFDYTTPALFAALEDTRRLFIQPRSFAPTYQQALQNFLNSTQKQLQKLAIPYHRCLTDASLPQLLRHVLHPTSAMPSASAGALTS